MTLILISPKGRRVPSYQPLPTRNLLLVCPFCQWESRSHIELNAHLNQKHPGWAADYIRKITGKTPRRAIGKHLSDST